MHPSHVNSVFVLTLLAIAANCGCRNTAPDSRIQMQSSPLAADRQIDPAPSGLRGLFHSRRTPQPSQTMPDQGQTRSSAVAQRTAAEPTGGTRFSFSDSQTNDAQTNDAQRSDTQPNQLASQPGKKTALSAEEEALLRKAFADASPEIRDLAERRMASLKASNQGESSLLSDQEGERLPTLPDSRVTAASNNQLQNGLAERNVQQANGQPQAEPGQVEKTSATTARPNAQTEPSATAERSNTDASNFGMPDLSGKANSQTTTATTTRPEVAQPATPQSEAAQSEAAQAAAQPASTTASTTVSTSAADTSPAAVETATADGATTDNPPGSSLTAVGDPLRNASEAALIAELLRRTQERIDAAQETPNLSDIFALRSLMLLDGRPDDAVKEVADWSAAEQDFLNYQMLAFWQLLDPQAHPVRQRRWAMALPHLREATSHMAAATDALEVRSLSFCEEVYGYGQTKPFPSSRFIAGQEVILYCEVDNFNAERLSDGFETHIRGSYQILDATGKRVAEQVLEDDKQTSANYRRDYYLPYLLPIPKQLTVGAYRLELTLEDVKGRKYGSASIPVEIIEAR
ncbi:hypothetical protein SH139x_000494 [Planctomycetaceae bacterium SH139]